ncbi:homeobox protein CDX-1 isoform X2 [Spea bombifrons]|uniref:homeobox protein CDX-1 isoform X2 n=1 Tax=Spea bombifrons TaxID=233779 RepID=UPI0023494153|nr:homeobox protein CDX-1 isoform X2 [Spea bombifrons]
MYVGYLLDKDSNMYPNPVRHPGLNLNHQNYVPAPPQYSDFASYHHVPGINSDPHHGQPGSTWSSPYAPSREDWHSYGPGPAASSNNPGQIGFSPTDFNPVQPPGSGLLPPPMNNSVPPLSPNAQRRNPYDWMKRSVVPSANPNNGKTRTKDKYRVVYTDHQRLELEKEFHYSRYITIRRKAELAATLALTERQVKIWFQNRRAKERKVNKKKMQQQSQQASTTTPTPPTVGTTTGMGGICSSSSSNSNLVSPSALTIKEEYLS